MIPGWKDNPNCLSRYASVIRVSAYHHSTDSKVNRKPNKLIIHAYLSCFFILTTLCSLFQIASVELNCARRRQMDNYIGTCSLVDTLFCRFCLLCDFILLISHCHVDPCFIRCLFSRASAESLLCCLNETFLPNLTVTIVVLFCDIEWKVDVKFWSERDIAIIRSIHYRDQPKIRLCSAWNRYKTKSRQRIIIIHTA